MSALLDDISRITASSISRREAFKLVGGAVGGALLAYLGVGRASRGLGAPAPDRCPRSRPVPCNGECYPPGYTCCGRTVCDGDDNCCTDHCCEKTRACCGSTCCPSGQTCISGKCCPSAQSCSGTCCPSGHTCVNGKCCPSAQVCGGFLGFFGRMCCTSGQTCINGNCCPSAQVCSSGRQCCPSGQVCCGNRCVNRHPSGSTPCFA
jgi:hypothetical protein